MNMQNAAATSEYAKLLQRVAQHQMTWLVTGVAGFIGSHLLETLLKHNQRVVGLDNFSTEHRFNLEEVRHLVGAAQWRQFSLIDGDIESVPDCRSACVGVDHVLHQAALGSVPRSIDDPLATNATNVTGFLNILVSARDAGVRSFTYAASSSTYGDHPAIPQVERAIGRPLSPYAVTKYINELYADIFAQCYGFNSIGLRYFNIFGSRQDPQGAYAAVIPKWTAALLQNELVFVNGDGEASRDFCYVDNVVQANLSAAEASRHEARNQIYNVALGERTTLNALFSLIRDSLEIAGLSSHRQPSYRAAQSGDVRHSQASIEKARTLLGYAPTHLGRRSRRRDAVVHR